MTDHAPIAGMLPHECGPAKPTGCANQPRHTRHGPPRTKAAHLGGRSESRFRGVLKIVVPTETEFLGTLLYGASLPRARSDVVKALIRRSHTLDATIACPERDLVAVDRVSESVAETLNAAQEMMLRTALGSTSQLSLQQLISAHAFVYLSHEQ